MAAASPEPTPADITVGHAPEQHRYELRDGDTVIGFTEYVLPDGGAHFDFVHTEVDPEYGGRGLAARLVASALDDVRARGRRIIAHCPYVAGYLRQHPEYDDIVDPAG